MSENKNSKIVLIRHGITEGNKNKWFYGAVDMPLLEEGKEALREQRNRGIYPETPEGTRFFTTGMLRTRETLREIYGDVDFDEIPALKEMAFGQFECKPYSILNEDPEFNRWAMDETGDIRIPEGESRNDFVSRVLDGWEQLKAMHLEGTPMSVVVCHGGTIASIMEHIYPGERDNMWAWIPDPGLGYVIEVDELGRALKADLIRAIIEEPK